LEVITDKTQLRKRLRAQKNKQKKIAFIPTMGNLHDGHLSLIDIAKNYSDCVVVSIFINPTQFLEGEDYDTYPRTIESDFSKLKSKGVSFVFVPENNEIYPSKEQIVKISLPELSSELCGKVRYGHFDGVASVVLRLFNIIRPDISIFGNKDYQQKIILQQMVADLSMNIKIIGGEIIREEDGLAMSSRNQFLSKSSRLKAKSLYSVLCESKKLINKKNKNFDFIECFGKKELEKNGFIVDYFSIRNKFSLKKTTNHDNLIIMASGVIDKVRLIDNIFVDHEGDQLC